MKKYEERGNREGHDLRSIEEGEIENREKIWKNGRVWILNRLIVVEYTKGKTQTNKMTMSGSVADIRGQSCFEEVSFKGFL